MQLCYQWWEVSWEMNALFGVHYTCICVYNVHHIAVQWTRFWAFIGHNHSRIAWHFFGQLHVQQTNTLVQNVRSKARSLNAQKRVQTALNSSKMGTHVRIHQIWTFFILSINVCCAQITIIQRFYLCPCPFLLYFITLQTKLKVFLTFALFADKV